MAADPTTFFIDLFILLGTAVVAGEVASRLGQAALVGQLLVGVILGPTLLGPYTGLTSAPSSAIWPELSAIQFLATVFILFMAGLEVSPEQLYRMGGSTLLLGIAIFAVPFAVLTVLAGALSSPAIHLFPAPGLTPIFLGLTLSITALPVMSVVLVEFGLHKSRLGNLLMNTALVNELVAVSVFAVLLQLRNGTENSGVAIAIAVLSVGVFLGVVLSIHMLLRLVRTTRWWESRRDSLRTSWRSREAGFAILMVGVIGASLFSQFMGLTFVVGAFYAGILVTQESVGPSTHRAIREIVDTFTWGFFIPLFFALVGVQMNLRLLGTLPLLALFSVVLAAAILTKVGTGYSIARFFSWPRVDALAIGHLVNSRGAVELAMAVLLLSDGVFTASLFTLVAGVGLVTTFLAPIAAKRAWSRAEAPSAAIGRRAERLRPVPAEDEADRPFPVSLRFGLLADPEIGLSPRDVRPEDPPGAAPLREEVSRATREEASAPTLPVAVLEVPAGPPPLPRPGRRPLPRDPEGSEETGAPGR